MIKRYKNLKLGQKLILIFLVISLIPITLIQMIHYARTKTSMTKQVSQVIRSNLIQISERTNLTLQVYTNVLYQLYVDDDLIHGCLVLEQGTDAQKAAARGTIMEEMRRGASVVEGVRTISLVCPNGEAVTYDTTTDSSVTIVSGMKKVQEGDLDQKITVQNRDELGMIADNFNLIWKESFINLSFVQTNMLQ